MEKYLSDYLTIDLRKNPEIPLTVTTVTYNRKIEKKDAVFNFAELSHVYSTLVINLEPIRELYNSLNGNSFTKKDIHELTGISIRLVQFYTENGVITPDIDKGEGRGKARRYSRENIFEFALVKCIADHKISIGRIREVLKIWRTR